MGLVLQHRHKRNILMQTNYIHVCMCNKLQALAHSGTRECRNRNSFQNLLYTMMAPDLAEGIRIEEPARAIPRAVRRARARGAQIVVAVVASATAVACFPICTVIAVAVELSDVNEAVAADCWPS